MNEIKILWLYSDLLDLYGDRGNISSITYVLKQNDIPFIVDEKSIFDQLDFNDYDMIYAGPGKDKNILTAAQHLNKYSEEIKKAVEDGKLFLICGNAQLLFGKTVTDLENNIHEGCGLFDYTARITGKVYIDDFIGKTELTEKPCYCFINRTSEIEGCNEKPLFDVLYSQKDIGKTEGIIKNNYCSTWALGPLLAKNPDLLKVFIEKLTGKKLSWDDSVAQKAYENTLAEFKQHL